MRLRALPELLRELDVTIPRQTSRGDGGSRGGGGMVFDPIASEASAALRTVLHGWVRVWDEQTPGWTQLRAGRDRLLSSSEGQAALLMVANLGSREWAPECADEIRRACAQGWAAVDIPPEQVFVGWCPDACGVPLYAREGAVQIQCRACGSVWDVQASRDAMLAAAHDVRATAAELARALDLDPALIRQWRRRGRLLAVDVDTAGRPLYRVSDVQALRSRPALRDAGPVTDDVVGSTAVGTTAG